MSAKRRITKAENTGNREDAGDERWYCTRATVFAYTRWRLKSSIVAMSLLFCRKEDAFVVLNNVQTSHATTIPSTPPSGVHYSVTSLTHVKLRLPRNFACFNGTYCSQPVDGDESGGSPLRHYPLPVQFNTPSRGNVCSRRSMQMNELSA